MRLRAATMFSGIGAPEVARPEWDWRWCAEIEKFPAEVHRLRHTQGGRGGNAPVPNLGDVSAPDFVERAREHGSIDVLVFGSPCQSFSVAGKRLGLDDPRGNLALISLEIARRLRPRWLVFENVPGLLSSDSGRDFGIFLRVMEQCGYLGAWRILDAQYAGVPQRRRRVFFVGHLGDWRPAAAVLFEPESLRGDPPPRREAREGITRAITAGFGSGSEIHPDGDMSGLIASHDPACTLTARERKGALPEADLSTVIAIQERAVSENEHAGPGGKGYRDDGLACTIEARTSTQAIAFDTTQVTSKANRSNPKPGDPCHPLAAGAHAPALAFSAKDHGGDAGETAPTLRAGGHANSHANAGVMPAIADGYAVRRLIPRECERLQGFADDFTAIPWRGKLESECPDGPRYEALGNSMAVPVMRWILGRIEVFENEVGRQAAA